MAGVNYPDHYPEDYEKDPPVLQIDFGYMSRYEPKVASGVQTAKAVSSGWKQLVDPNKPARRHAKKAAPKQPMGSRPQKPSLQGIPAATAKQPTVMSHVDLTPPVSTYIASSLQKKTHIIRDASDIELVSGDDSPPTVRITIADIAASSILIPTAQTETKKLQRAPTPIPPADPSSPVPNYYP